MAMQELCAHLWERGYRRPGFLSGPTTLSTALGRRSWFLRAWAERGVDAVTDLEADRYYDAGVSAAAVRAYLNTTPADRRVDVLACENDILAVGAMDVARSEFALQVPDDLAITSFDDDQLAGFAAYDLTTYRQPREEMVQTVVDMILERRPRTTVNLRGRLITRRST